MTTEPRHVQRCCLAVPPFHSDNCVNSPMRRNLPGLPPSQPQVGYVVPAPGMGKDSDASLLFDDLGNMTSAPMHRVASRDELALERLLIDLAGASNVDADTPGRLLRALTELTEGYKADLLSLCKTFDSGGPDPGIVTVRDMPFASLCEHHVLPFTGKAAVAYIPSDKIIGLSKIPRLLRAVTRRLQIQERIGAMVADTMMTALAPRGVMVIVRARHTCMAIRGVESSGEMVTSCVRGVFATDAAARAEAMELLVGGG